MPDSSDPTILITADELEYVNDLRGHTSVQIQRQCTAANSGWPMAEKIWFGVVMRCPEEAFDQALQLFNGKMQNILWLAFTSLKSEQVHSFAAADEDTFDLFYGCLFEYAPEAITDAEIVRYSYA